MVKHPSEYSKTLEITFRKANADVLYNTHFFVMVGTPNIMLLIKILAVKFCSSGSSF